MPIGPYSSIIIKNLGNFKIAFVSGQIPIDEKGEILNYETIEKQTELSIQNLKKVLESNGFGLKDIVKTTVFLTDINDFEKMNEVYAKFFDKIKPARSTVEVSNLPKKVKIEIEAIAIKN